MWGTEPPAGGCGFEDVTEQVAREMPTADVRSEVEGRATVASYTVLFGGEWPQQGIALCDLPDGSRTIGATSDPGLAQAMTEEEFCGRAVKLGADGSLAAA